MYIWFYASYQDTTVNTAFYDYGVNTSLICVYVNVIAIDIVTFSWNWNNLFKMVEKFLSMVFSDSIHHFNCKSMLVRDIFLSVFVLSLKRLLIIYASFHLLLIVNFQTGTSTAHQRKFPIRERRSKQQNITIN